MFRNKTVFLLGAGASWHYGYPTGEQLVRQVADAAHALKNYAEAVGKISISNPLAAIPSFIADHYLKEPGTGLLGMKQAWEGTARACLELIARLAAVEPLVIDYFLGQNPDLRNLGKLLIAWVILEREAQFLKDGGNINRRLTLLDSPHRTDVNAVLDIDVRKFKDRWYRFIIHNLANDCEAPDDLLKNDVWFVTFNYDVSLDYLIFKGLRAISFFRSAQTEAFLTQGRITHIYGQVRDHPEEEPPMIDFNALRDVGKLQQDPNTFGGTWQGYLNTIYDCSKNLRTIAPLEKIENQQAISHAAQIIADAKYVYILGYGFDETNGRLLKLDEGLRNGQKQIMFTNLNDSNRINKKASLLLTGSDENFLGKATYRHAVFGIDHVSDMFVEKSVRDVYGALEMDFDALHT